MVEFEARRNPQARLVFTGDVVVDLVLELAQLPKSGDDVTAQGSAVMAGGGYNVMVAAARDGLEVVFAGQYGTGFFGNVVRSALDESGFTVVQSGLDHLDSGYCVALIDSGAERTFVSVVGAEAQLLKADLDRVELAVGDIVYISGYSLSYPVNSAALDAWISTIPTLVTVITDPSPLVADLDQRIFRSILARTDLLSLNTREAGVMTGGLSPDLACLALLESVRQGATVVVRDGKNGCYLATKDANPILKHIPGFVVNAIDMNGAGDAHCGVLAAALSRGEPLDAAGRRANAAAAIAVTRRGPATSPESGEIDAYLASNQLDISNCACTICRPGA